ncbi:uncharacterized protein LOC131628158 [Vicia villosa]|uniref:uncharacterized protein LOC131628158 n=1 Tax=Vicia villosa TaxID=3911 RepID=UPI00273C1644|nr:uncharacterized protein LOC131628158 [Vicia villosa]
MTDELTHSFWRSSDIGFSYSNLVGRSGGIITLWRKDRMEVLYSFKGEGFLGLKVRWMENTYYIVNIYSSCDLSKKKSLWADLLALRSKKGDGEWILGGDFNAIKNGRERKGRAVMSNNREHELFKEFIDLSGLVDVPCKEKNFSWFSGDGKSKSQIDRFLLSSTVVERWDVIGQMIGDRDISDQCPIWIMLDNKNWGPKPFKFNNEWFSSEAFIPFVMKEWNSFDVKGRGDFILKEKLRLFKEVLKRWNKEVFGKIDLEVEDVVHEINDVDERLHFNSLPFSFDEDVIRRKEASCSFWKNLRIKENMLLQRSRLSWLKEGDSNSGFFSQSYETKKKKQSYWPDFFFERFGGNGRRC